MAPVSNWRWNPNPKQKEMFEEWKSFCIGLLITSREGFHVRSIPKMLEEQTGEPMPIKQMGFPSINHFLYAMAENIEIRSLMGQYYVFVKDYAIPQELQHVREMVLGQQKDKTCKSKSGKIRRPTKKQSCYVPIHEFLTESANAYSAYQQQRNPIPNRPVLVPTARFTNRNIGTGSRGMNRSSSYQNSGSSLSRNKWSTPNYPASKPVSYTSTQSFSNWSDVPKTSNSPKPPQRNIQPRYTAPVRPRYIDGLVDDEESDLSDYEGFEIVSGVTSSSFKTQNKTNNTMSQVNVKPEAKSAVTSVLTSTAATPKPMLPSTTVTSKPADRWSTVRKVASTSSATNANAPSNFYRTPTEIILEQPRLGSSLGIHNNSSNLNPRTTIESPRNVSLPQTPSVVKDQDEMVQSVINKITLANANHFASLRRESAKAVVPDPDPPKLKSSVETFTTPVPPVSITSKTANSTTKPIIDLHPNVGLKQTHPNSNTEPQGTISAVIDLHPNIGYSLDRRNDLTAGSSAIRISFQLPDIKFPPFLKGGTKECNSLKVFLQLTNQSLDKVV